MRVIVKGLKNLNNSLTFVSFHDFIDAYSLFVCSGETYNVHAEYYRGYIDCLRQFKIDSGTIERLGMKITFSEVLDE